MADFNGFLASIESLRRDVAKFHRVVLHSHSLHSTDYGRPLQGAINGCAASNDGEFEKLILNSRPDLVALTDHMKCEYSCRLSESAANRGKCILPGMEVNIRPPAPWNSFRIHVLTVFPERYCLEQIAKMLPKTMPPEKDRTGDEEITDVNLVDFISHVHSCDGICIAAHIDSDRGVRKTFRQLGKDGIVFCATDEVLSLDEQKKISEEFKEWLLKAGFDAIEVADCAHKVHYRWVSEDCEVSVPALLRNDAHRVEDLDDEAWHNHIKMTTPSFQDLKSALRFPETRIRFPSDVPASPSPRILGLQIVAGDDKGFFQTINVAFADNLSCLIGPRGSGKSAIIESLRYVFGFNRILGQLDQSGTDLVKKVRGLQTATLANSIIRVAYLRADGQTHILESTFDSKQDYATKVYAPDGNELDIRDLDTSGAYVLRLFGWSEIETLGREAGRQRDLLDRLIPEFAPLWEKRNTFRQSLRNKKREIQTSVETLGSLLEMNSGEIKKFKEYQGEFARLNTPEIDALFANIDIGKRKLVLLNKVSENTLAWLDRLNNADGNVMEGVDQLLKESPEPIQLWWAASIVKSQISVSQTETRSIVKKATDELQRLKQQIAETTNGVTKELQEREKEIREKIGQEATKQVAADLRKTAAERLERVNQLRRQYDEQWKRLHENINAWKTICGDLILAQRNVSQSREKQKEQIESKLNLYSTAEMSITVRFHPSGDRAKLISHLAESGVLGKKNLGNYKANSLPQRISSVCNPVELACALLDNDSAQLEQSKSVGKEPIAIDAATAQRLVSSFYPFSNDDEANVPTIDKDRIENILNMSEIEWDDDERILLNGKPVDSLSPGQRSSAMLPLIALAENAPLIIDQPEDNLDNRLVGKMLVDILASLKEKRQIIVATHNPNIVVSGDAEQVIVLEALSDHEDKCTQAGSIDKEPIVKSVIDIMEGGKEAFRTRQRRYGF